jgi:ankyrin repeat protein
MKNFLLLSIVKIFVTFQLSLAIPLIVQADTSAFEEANTPDSLTIGYNLLYYSKINNLQEVKRIITANPYFVNFTDNNNVTSLIFAAQSGADSIVLYLINNGIDINTITFDYELTALIAAAKNNHLRSAEILIRNGAMLNHRDAYGRTALHYAVLFAFDQMTDMLLYYEAEINNKDNWGYTPLAYAVENNDLFLAELLIEKGADLDVVSGDKSSLFHIAAYNGNLEFLKKYYNTTKDKEKLNKDNMQPIDVALLGGQAEIFEWFTSLGENPREKINDVYTSLILAEASGDKTTIEIVKSMGTKSLFYMYPQKISLGYDFIFNKKDFIMSPSVGIMDSRYGFSAELGFLFRGYERRILMPVSSNSYYQLRESRYGFSLGMMKDFKIDQSSINTYWSVSFKLKGVYFFGNYDGMNLRVSNDIKISPAVGINIISNSGLKTYFDISYLNTDIYLSKTIFYTIGIKGLVNFRKYSDNEKYKYIINY